MRVSSLSEASIAISRDLASDMDDIRAAAVLMETWDADLAVMQAIEVAVTQLELDTTEQAELAEGSATASEASYQAALLIFGDAVAVQAAVDAAAASAAASEVSNLASGNSASASAASAGDAGIAKLASEAARDLSIAAKDLAEAAVATIAANATVASQAAVDAAGSAGTATTASLLAGTEKDAAIVAKTAAEAAQAAAEQAVIDVQDTTAVELVLDGYIDAASAEAEKALASELIATDKASDAGIYSTAAGESASTAGDHLDDVQAAIVGMDTYVTDSEAAALRAETAETGAGNSASSAAANAALLGDYVSMTSLERALPTKAEFGALAEERKANRSGSGGENLGTVSVA